MDSQGIVFKDGDLDSHGTAHLTISSAGLATFSAGIAFSSQTDAAGMTATTLNHYEEGTWTPSVGGDATYSAQSGRYTRVGRLVTCTFDMTVNVLGTGSGNIVSGLPFPTTDSIGNGGGVSYYTSLAASPTVFAPTVSGSTVVIRSTLSAGTGVGNYAILGNSARIACVVAYTV
jgi:hypothetical protein